MSTLTKNTSNPIKLNNRWYYLSEHFRCRVTKAQKISKLLFPVFNLIVYPSSKVTAQSKLKEPRMLIRSRQNEGKRGAKVDGIYDLTYKTNSGSEAIPQVKEK